MAPPAPAAYTERLPFMLLVLRLILAAATLAACTPRVPTDYRGTALPDPKPKPAVVLTDTQGSTFDFRRETEGKLALVFFGYTYCPDICPMHMANLAAVLREMPFEVQHKTQVLFVTVDPQRDTPERLRDWLANFDRTFIGLRGDPPTIARFQRELMLPEAVTSPGERPGEYNVGHAGQVIAFTPDGLARYVYPFGTRQEDWAYDLPLLAGAPQPRHLPTHGPATQRAPKVAAPVAITRALIPAAPRDRPTALYAVITNSGARGDALLRIATPVAGRAELHRMATQAGRMMMEPVTEAAVAPGAALRLAPGGYHGMLLQLTTGLAPGAELPVTFTFRYAGPVTVTAKVVPYDQVEGLLDEGQAAQ